jgi:hypothetical protein
VHCVKQPNRAGLEHQASGEEGLKSQFLGFDNFFKDKGFFYHFSGLTSKGFSL